MLVNRIMGALESRRQLCEFLLALQLIPLLRVERGGDFAHLFDICANRHLLVSDLIQAAVDAAR